uniref:Uncharacterized protein n=1 Tax=Lactuca sativa TaxID=4236 RepID=A0A9R1UQA9_LACSA|nr:hypothetical protein LSAT_V11C800438520 [Lactuca sativa]
MVKDSAGFTPAQIAAHRGHHHVSLILSNAHRAQNSCWKDKSWIKKIRDIFYALILLSLVFVGTLIFINFVLFASNLVKVTAVVRLWGWTVVILSIAYLLMVIRCSSKDSGYVNMSGGIKNNVDAKDFFVFLFLGTLTIARRKRCLIYLLMRLDKKNVLERVIFVSEKLVICVGYDCNPMVFATDKIRSYIVGR